MRLAWLFFTLAGCAKEATLAQLANKILFVSVSGSGGLGVELQYDDSKICQIVGDNVAATFNGTTVDLFNAGTTSVSTGGESCAFPLWESPEPSTVPEVATFTLHDTSATVSGSFENLFSNRGYTLVSAAHATAGNTVALLWAPASDTYDSSRLEIIFAPSGQTGAVIATGTQITASGGLLSFVLPATAAKGTGDLLVTGDANAGVMSCTGADRCEASFQVASLIPFTVN